VTDKCLVKSSYKHCSIPRNQLSDPSPKPKLKMEMNGDGDQQQGPSGSARSQGQVAVSIETRSQQSRPSMGPMSHQALDTGKRIPQRGEDPTRPLGCSNDQKELYTSGSCK
jgi:hypothetical protein